MMARVKKAFSNSNKVNEVVSLLDYGAVNGGVIDCSAAFQEALSYLNSFGGGKLIIPKGTWRKADTTATLICYSNITIEGEGDASIILHDDVDTNARRDLIDLSNTDNVTLKNFAIHGTVQTYLNETNQSQTLIGGNISNIRIDSLTIKNVRYMAMAFNNVDGAYVTGCRLENVVRDGYRFVQSQDVRILNNSAFNVSDDVVALHQSDAGNPKNAIGNIVSGNTFTQCQGLKALGAKALTVSGNIFRRSLRTPIFIRMAESGEPEGDTPAFNINIKDNQILDTIGNKGTSSVLFISSGSGRDPGGESNQPGINASVFTFNYQDDITNAANPNIGLKGVIISGNNIARTLPATANWSDYGYGQLFDRVDVGFYTDPATSDSTFACHYVNLKGPIYGYNVSNNNMTGLSTGKSCILLEASTPASQMDISSLLINNNNVFDCPGPFVTCTDVGSGVGSKEIFITNNLIDLDPFFRNSAHNSDNTWSTSGALPVINNGTVIGIHVGGNSFKNCSSTGVNNDEINVIFPNRFYGEFVSHADNSSNKGIRLPPATSLNIGVFIDGDPTSATYGQVQNMPRTHSSAMPTSGSYLRGHRTKNNTPTLSAGSFVDGWVRLTTGNAHVLNTDWAEMKHTI